MFLELVSWSEENIKSRQVASLGVLLSVMGVEE